MRVNDLIAGLVLVALAAAMIAYTTTFPAFPGQKYGPSLFPRLLGAGLILCGLLLTVRGLAARRAGGPWLSLAPWTRDPWRVISLLSIPAVVLAYILVSEQIGFLPVAFVIVLSLFLWFRVRIVVAVPTALGAVWIVHWFFASLMRVPLPRGLLTNVL